MYAKLFSTVLDSSIWSQEDHVRLLWITLLAMSDQNGYVWACPSGLQRRARITPAEVENGLKVLCAPDPEDSSGNKQGCRLELVQGGWLIVNYAHYRDLVDADTIRHQTKIRVRRHREKVRSVTPGNDRSRSVTPSDQIRSDTESSSSSSLRETHQKKSKSAHAAAKKVGSRRGKPKSFELWWDAYPRKVAKEKAKTAHQKAVLGMVRDKNVPEASDAEAILIDSVDTLAEVAKQKGADLRFCPYPATYLNQSRWDDTREMWEILLIPKEDKRGGRNLVG